MYRKVTSTSPSHLKAHAGLFSFQSMKGKFIFHLLWPFWKKLISVLVSNIITCNFMVQRPKLTSFSGVNTAKYRNFIVYLFCPLKNLNSMILLQNWQNFLILPKWPKTANPCMNLAVYLSLYLLSRMAMKPKGVEKRRICPLCLPYGWTNFEVSR